MRVPGMRASVSAAWPAVCSLYEGRCWWMYLDTKKLVTTGLGILLEEVGEAQSFPWFRVSDKLPASQDEIAAEYRRVKGLTRLASSGGFAYRPSARLRLPDPTIDEQLVLTTTRFWRDFLELWPEAGSWPADAQLAAMDLCWQNGQRFTEKRKFGVIVWKSMRAAFAGQDWERAAAAVPINGPKHARGHRRARLFRNAAKVKQLGLDPEILWDAVTPVSDNLGGPGLVVVVPPPPEIPPPLPPIPGPARLKPERGSRDEWVLVNSRGVIQNTTRKRPGIYWVTTRFLNMYREAGVLFLAAGGKSVPEITQGGKGSIGASKGTHDKEAGDTSIRAILPKLANLWELCLWLVGFAAWTRTEIPRLWVKHNHAVPKGGHLAELAEAQVEDFEAGRNGLKGHAPYPRIAEAGAQLWTWEDYLARWGTSLSALQQHLGTDTRHDDVAELQAALSRHLGRLIVADGWGGPMTVAALAEVGPLEPATLETLDLVVLP